MPTPLLILVHPGSACRSADDNLGRDEACKQRLDMQAGVQAWEGAMLVVDGELSDELAEGRDAHVEWGQAIEAALERNAALGYWTERIHADDNSEVQQEEAVLAKLNEKGLKPKNIDIEVGGAWYHSSDGTGCVGGVLGVLQDKKYRARLGDVMDLDTEFDEEDEDDSEEEEEPSLISPRRRGP